MTHPSDSQDPFKYKPVGPWVVLPTGEVVSFYDSHGNLEVALQDQHTKMLDLYFIQSQGATTLLNNANANDQTIDLTSTTGFVDGSYVGIFSALGVFYFGTQIGAAVGNTITLDTPIDNNFLAGDNVIRASKNLNVDGSTTTQIFQIGPVGGATLVSLDITRVTGYIQDNLAMDDSKFGAMPALTNGIVLRKHDTVYENIWNAKTNGDLALICASDLIYTDSAPAGSFGARFRNTFAGTEKHGVTVRLEPGEILELLVQDDLTPLQAFYMMAQGHVVD